MPCNPIVIASCWDYLCFLLKFPFTDPFLGHKVYWMIEVLFTKALINQEEPKVSCYADKMEVFFQLPSCKENHFNKHFQISELLVHQKTWQNNKGWLFVLMLQKCFLFSASFLQKGTSILSASQQTLDPSCVVWAWTSNTFLCLHH